jgi:hypothetical protein
MILLNKNFYSSLSIDDEADETVTPPLIQRDESPYFEDGPFIRAGEWVIKELNH